MPMSRKKMCVVFSGGVLLLAAGGIMIPVVDMLHKDQVTDKMVLDNGSELWKAWKHPPVPSFMNFYMFNVTNPEQVRKGEKPLLTEHGPYTYKVNSTKVDVTENANGTVSFREVKSFKFERNMSVGDPLTDKFTTLNLAVVAAIELLQVMPIERRRLFSNAMQQAGEDLFLTRPVHDLLWGYTDPVLTKLKAFYPRFIPTDFIGYFINKNDTVSETFTIFSGKFTRENLGQIQFYNGSKFLSNWSTVWANMINGTDGTVFPPFQQAVDTLHVFSADMCRSSRLVYEKDVRTKQSISLKRFVVPESELANTTANPDNLGFCTPNTSCLPTGLLNLTACLAGNVTLTPLPHAIASYPHFYLADPTVQSSVQGLSPQKDKHQSNIDVEPWTGMVLQAYKRLQINMRVKQVPEVGLTYNIQSLYFPIVWLSETMEIDNAHAVELQRDMFAPMEIAGVLEKVFMIVGAGLVLVIIFVTCRNRGKSKSRLVTLAPGPIPTMTSNGTRRRVKRGQTKEKMPLLADARDPNSSLPPPPPPSYQRPPIDNGIHNMASGPADSAYHNGNV